LIPSGINWNGYDTQGLVPSEAARAGIEAYTAFCRDHAIDIALGVSVPESDVEALASRAMRDGCTATNPRPLQQDDFVVLFANLG
jgi:alcohol dehydrogenase class IV